MAECNNLYELLHGLIHLEVKKETRKIGKEQLEEVGYDEAAGMHYALWKGKRMYYPRGYSRENVAAAVGFVRLEQDVESPHRYRAGDFDVREGDVVVDAGAAEGNFALEVVERARKVYIVEPDHKWVEALRKTFEPWADKVVIVERLLGNTEDEAHTRIDSFVEEGEIGFLKMDVEGAEAESLRGAAETLANSRNVRCAICAYHRKGAEKEIREILEGMGFFTATTGGYMFFKDDIDSWVDCELRRGIVRAEKGQGWTV